MHVPTPETSAGRWKTRVVFFKTCVGLRGSHRRARGVPHSLNPPVASDHVSLLCASLFVSASLWRADRVGRVGRRTLLSCLQLQSMMMMMKCIYFQHWDLAPHNTGLNGSRWQIVILLDFNKCYMVIFIKIDFLPLNLLVWKSLISPWWSWRDLCVTQRVCRGNSAEMVGNINLQVFFFSSLLIWEQVYRPVQQGSTWVTEQEKHVYAKQKPHYWLLWVRKPELSMFFCSTERTCQISQ